MRSDKARKASAPAGQFVEKMRAGSPRDAALSRHVGRLPQAVAMFEGTVAGNTARLPRTMPTR